MSCKEKPMVSAIMRCRNEARSIEKALMTVLKGDYPADRMELLVVDGMSTDGTREIVQKIAAEDSRIKLLDNPAKILPSATNIGIKAAQGEYIVALDAHLTYSRNYITKCIETIQRTRADNVGGYWTTLPGADTSVAKAIAAALSSKFGIGNSTFRLSGLEQEVDTVPFGTYRKDLFDKIGLYDERLVRNQDIELNSRIRKAGGHIVISPEIKLNYYSRATYSGLKQQAFNNGLWGPYVVWLTGGGLYLRHFMPVFFVLGLITFTIGAFFWRPVKWVLLSYILLYVSTALVFSIKVAQHKKAHAILILWSYIVLHVSYGFGSLWAIITIPFKFPDRHKKKTGKPLADREM